MTTDAPIPAASRPAGGAKAGAARRTRRHPLLGAFPLAVITLATFLVVLTILMARLQSGVDPALGPFANHSLVVPASSGGSVVTRASGSVAAPAASTTAPTGATSPVVTRTSGSVGGGEAD